MLILQRSILVYISELSIQMVFQLTARISICQEIADDPVEVAKLTNLFWAFDKSNTTMTVLLPWLPQQARRTRTETIMSLYQMLLVHIVDRRITGRREEDSMQVLIDAGDSTRDIVEVSIGLDMREVDIDIDP
jgi:hypothetical protein